MDNFEWTHGYSLRFGMYSINFSGPNRKRTPKASSIMYTQIIKDNGFTTGYNGPGGTSTGPILHEKGYLYDRFPEDFYWSTATAAYQVEGAVDEDGKSRIHIFDKNYKLRYL